MVASVILIWLLHSREIVLYSISAAMSQKPFLTARWHHLAMANYVIDPDVLRPHVPQGVQLDSYDGQSFVSLVGFMFLDTSVRGWAIPGHRNFEEVNLRFYVRRETPEGIRRGVVFIKEIVPRSAITAVARWVYGENYVTHPMRHELDESGDSIRVEYGWRVDASWNHLRFTSADTPQLAQKASIEQFITEHYWGYTQQRSGATLEYEVQHPSWNIWHRGEVEVNVDAARLYGPQFAEVLSGPPHSALLADGSEVAVYPANRVRD